MALYFKSAVYLGVFGSLGYILMKVSEPSEEKKRRIAQSSYVDPEAKSQKALFLKKLQQATTDEPLYLRKSSPRGSSADDYQPEPKQPTKREIN
jgi:Ubiquinol-cytochrome-c reductase complex assembly factor 3